MSARVDSCVLKHACVCVLRNGSAASCAIMYILMQVRARNTEGNMSYSLAVKNRMHIGHRGFFAVFVEGL